MAPSKVATVPKLVIPNDIKQQTKQIVKVMRALAYLSSLPLPLTSSTESFIGKIQNGAANVITIKMPNKQI